MSNATYEVISTFLDDEPFDPQKLAMALDDPAGRALLIDSIALRHIVQPRETAPTMRGAESARRSGWRVVAAAAALFVAVVGGYVVGERRSSQPATDAPPATRVVQAIPFTPDGGSR